jgi:hypothetical protein
MSKTKLLAVRVEESLIPLLDQTAKILERNQAETIRILLYRACKYWITRGKLTQTEKIITTINEQSQQTPISINDDELERLELAMKLIK